MSNRLKVEFPGSQGENLSGLLELPDTDPASFVLFAHCFTCGKDIAAASRIAKELVKLGFAVLRFDFTGLGNSDGDFANTNFSSNVQDLVLAAAYLRENHKAPGLLIGHSLGGTAILKAAHEIPESKGVVTIGSPAGADHVSKQFVCDIDTIEREGEATVQLAGRSFLVKKQFVEDIRDNKDTNVNALRKALLVLHSPIDSIVPIEQAEKIFVAAKHPKSFVSLDDADHLLSKKPDAQYAAVTIAAWASRYVSEQSAAQVQKLSSGHVLVSERDHRFAQDVHSDSHHWIADEPASVGGSNFGPDPYEHLLASLGTCTAMTMRMYADRKKWPVEHISIELNHARDHGQDCAECDEAHPQIDIINRKISISGPLDDEQRERILAIADKCPVHRTMHNKLIVKTEAVD